MTDRRDFIKALGAAALAPALQPLAPSLHSRASLRKLDRIGLQLYTVRHAMEKDVEDTIARVAHRVELQRSEEHTSELQSQSNLVCRLLLEKKKNRNTLTTTAKSACNAVR